MFDFSNIQTYNDNDYLLLKSYNEVILLFVSYKPLWKLLIDRDMTKTDLRKETDIASSTLAKMSHNEYVSLEVLVRICKALDCELNDIVEIEK